MKRSYIFLCLCLFSLSACVQKRAVTVTSAETKSNTTGMTKGETTGMTEGEITGMTKEEPTGITFLEKPFAELLDRAKAENKVIFIDAFTTWCGPCKMMSKQVFPQPEVGAVYNERFINTKIDMEKGEGPDLARRYRVTGYPTYLFVDGNGEIVHRGLGYIPAQKFLELADVAAGDQSLGALTKRYDAGERTAGLMKAYSEVLTDVDDKRRAGMVADEYLASLDDWNDPEVLDLLVANPGAPGGKRLKFLMANSEAAMERAGEAYFMGSIQQAFFAATQQREKSRGWPEVATMQATYDAFGGAMKERLLDHYVMVKAERTRDTEAYLPAAVNYLGKYGSDNPTELNSAAWSVFEASDDPEQLETALGWAKKSVEIEAGYPNMDTLAWLYHKTGNKEMAKATALKAIEMAKATGQDYADTAKILEK